MNRHDAPTIPANPTIPASPVPPVAAAIRSDPGCPLTCALLAENGIRPGRRAQRGGQLGERGERGMAAVELVILAPTLLLIMLFVVGLGRMAHARQQVESVAADAARAASLESSEPAARTAARSAATRSLGDAGLSCTGLTVDLDLSRYQPGGALVATVSCRAQLGDVTLSGLPGSRVFRATSTVPIETYRSELTR